MTGAAGAPTVTTLAAAIAKAENKVVPVRLFPEQGASRRTANVAYRLARLALFDVPQEVVVVVVNHEVFGHGARLRELFDGSINYRVELPPPYGDGGGSTTSVLDRAPSIGDRLAISTAGMEASAVAASAMASGVVRRGSMDWREAIRYIGFETDTFFYVQDTGDGPEESGHDVSDFLLAYNDASHRLEGRPLTAQTLKREALVGLANPLLVYAAIGIAKYVWSGAPTVGVPAFSIGGRRFLPMARYRLTPYGTEFALATELASQSRASTIELRVGRAPETTPWGVSVTQQPVARRGSWTFGAAAHAWRQEQLGAAVFTRAQRAVPSGWFGGHALSFVVEAGVKSGGFVPGQPLASGPTLRVGVGLPLR